MKPIMNVNSSSPRIEWQVVIGVCALGLIVLCSLAAPIVTSHDPIAQEAPAQKRYLPPSSEHAFGCDQFGRDVFSRVLYGGRISLLIAFVVMSLSVTLGISFGAFAGLAGGLWDQLLMRLIDVFLAFPVMFLAVTCLALLGSDLWSLVLILTLTSWMDVARLVRAEILSLKQQAFVLKARAAGIGTLRIVVRHLLPNTFATVLVVCVFRVADVILLESALSFLGLGVQPPTASWGAIVNDGRMVLSSAWWLTVFPGLAIVITTVSLHMIGENLRARVSWNLS